MRPNAVMRVSASAYTIHCCACPSSKWPTTVQSLPRMGRRSPISKPTNWRLQALLATSSCSPGLKARPAVKRRSGASSVIFDVTPTSGKKMRLPVTRPRPSMGAIAWKTTIGSPFASLRTRGKPRTTAASCLVILPWPMPRAPGRQDDAVRANVGQLLFAGPGAHCKIETNVPTAQVTPTTIVSAEPIRCVTPDRLTRRMARSCRTNFIRR